MELCDVYVYIESADKEQIEKFICNHLKGWTTKEDYFEYPKYSFDKSYETADFNEMFNFITNYTFKKYTFYLECPEWVDGKGGIIQTYEDNSVCLGLSVLPEKLDEYKLKLEEEYGESNVFVLYNIPPPQESKIVRNFLNSK